MFTGVRCADKVCIAWVLSYLQPATPSPGFLCTRPWCSPRYHTQQPFCRRQTLDMHRHVLDVFVSRCHLAWRTASTLKSTTHTHTVHSHTFTQVLDTPVAKDVDKLVLIRAKLLLSCCKQILWTAGKRSHHHTAVISPNHCRPPIGQTSDSPRSPPEPCRTWQSHHKNEFIWAAISGGIACMWTNSKEPQQIVSVKEVS